MTAAPDIPGYQLTGIIGEGGYATVYHAWQVAVGRDVAVKIDNRVLLNPRDQRRFVREVTAAGRLSGHPHVIDMYDAGMLPDGRPYMVMELCPGGSLADALRRHGAMNPAQVRDTGIKIADALAAAHAVNVLHRDVKPANILVNRYGVVGLADFGLASIWAPGADQSVTRETLTPAYAAPEQFRGEEPSVACDLYSLAATLYCLLAGRPPRFPADGRQPSVATIISLHGKPIDDIPGVPPALMAALQRTLADDPALRPRSADELRHALIAAPAAPAEIAPASPAEVKPRPSIVATFLADLAAGEPTVRTDPSTGSAPDPGTRSPRGTVRADVAVSRRRPKVRLIAFASAASAVIIAAAAFLLLRALPSSAPAAAPPRIQTTQSTAAQGLSASARDLISRLDDLKNFPECDLAARSAAGADATLTCATNEPGITMTVSSFRLTGPAIPFSPDLIAGESSGLDAFLKVTVPSSVPALPTGFSADTTAPCPPKGNTGCPHVGYSGFWGNPQEPITFGRLYFYQKSGSYHIVWTFDNDEYENLHKEDFVVVASGGDPVALLSWWRTTSGL